MRETTTGIQLQDVELQVKSSKFLHRPFELVGPSGVIVYTCLLTSLVSSILVVYQSNCNTVYHISQAGSVDKVFDPSCYPKWDVEWRSEKCLSVEWLSGVE